MAEIEEKPYSFYLRKRREEKGLSQQDLANRTGLERTYISRLEGGKLSNPSYRLQSALAVRGFGLTMSEFFSDEAIRSEPPTINIVCEEGSRGLKKTTVINQHHLAIPLVAVDNAKAMLSGTIRDEDRVGYTVIGSHTLSQISTKNPNLIAISTQSTEGGVMMVIDLADRELRAGKEFATHEHGTLIPRRVTHIQQGLLLQHDHRSVIPLPPEQEFILLRPNSTQVVDVIGRVISVIVQM